MKSFNRHLDDPVMDNMDHALGRPLNPLGRVDRNFYAIAADDQTTIGQLVAHPWWLKGRTFLDITAFHVSDQGKAALVEYLKEHWKTPRPFRIITNRGEGDEIHETIVYAETASKARYQHFIDHEIGDAMSFREYLKITKVRVSK